VNGGSSLIRFDVIPFFMGGVNGHLKRGKRGENGHAGMQFLGEINYFCHVCILPKLGNVFVF